MKIRLLLMTAALCLAAAKAAAQAVTPAFTVYEQFRPANVILADGRLLKLNLANVFLKNSTLLYLSGSTTKQANMDNIRRVDFKDRTYYKVDTLLAYQVDTVGTDALLCAQKIDFVAYKQSVENNREITSLDLGDMIGFTTADLSDEKDIHFPVVNEYYFKLNGQYVLAHERRLRKLLSKDKKRVLDGLVAEKDFSWTDEKSLLNLLKHIR